MAGITGSVQFAEAQSDRHPQSDPKLERSPRYDLQAVIQQLSNIETRIENVIGGSNPAEVPLMNQIIARQLDRLAAILVELQADIDRN
jgi:hypothetical protein